MSNDSLPSSFESISKLIDFFKSVMNSLPVIPTAPIKSYLLLTVQLVFDWFYVYPK